MAKYFTPSKISENIGETPEGFLVCIGVPIARTGEMVYGDEETPIDSDEEGKVLIYRDEADVFHVNTIASFEGKAVTIKHPTDFVTPKNWSYLAKGTMQNVRKSKEKDEDGEWSLLADLLITDELAIQLIKNGLRGVSCGYEAEYEELGEGKGRQRKIVGNHLALVEEGRAGKSYAINDHKGKGTMSQLAEKMKKLFAKAVDEAVEGEKKEEKAKDEPEMKEKKEEKAKDADYMDELVKMVKDLSEKIDGMKSSKDEKEEEPKKDEPAKDDEKDGDKEDAKDDEESSLEDRLKAVEMAVSKLLEKESGESEDEDGDEEEKSEDDDFEESTMTGDEASRIEILAPGLKPGKKEDAKVKALEAAYGTKDGKAVIDSLTGGKKPVFDSAEKVSTLFIAASEVLRSKRGNGLEKTKDAKAFDSGESKVEAMTVEKLNEINAAHWGQKVGK